MTATLWLWVGFTAVVLALLALDLGVFHRDSHAVSLKEAGIWTAVWVGLAAAFNGGVYLFGGTDDGLAFTAGYLVELALSVDNLFVIALIFASFAVPPAYQHRVLFWGILGALVMRLTFILAGAALLETFDWLIYIFGAFLIVTGVRLLAKRDAHGDPRDNRVLKLFRRVVPMTEEYHGQRFTIREAGQRLATPLLAVLVLVEATDLVFALDSVPAIFAITDKPFIVYTSNVFAILGLRSMYFLLAGALGLFRYLKVGLGLVLVFVGAKMALANVFHVPVAASLGVIVLVIGGSIAASLLTPHRQASASAGPAHHEPVA